MSGPVTLALPALEVRLTDAGGGRVAVWLAAVGSAASERVATVARPVPGGVGMVWTTERKMPEVLREALSSALYAHFVTERAP